MVSTKDSVSLTKYFSLLQEEMLVSLKKSNLGNKHPGTKGDCSELKWIEWLEAYLPKRYSVDKAQVIDYKGNISDQIDIVIFDSQYTPFIFKDGDAKYIPAESVYAIFEVKQNLNKEHLDYASKKAESVRKLTRTSAQIYHMEGIAKPKPLHNIIAGILTLSSDWAENSTCLDENLNQLTDIGFLNMGCTLQDCAFCVDDKGHIAKSTKDESLMYFFLKLMMALQKIATVPAIEIDKYASCLTNF